MEAFAGMLGVKTLKPVSARIPTDNRRSFDPGERQKRQVKALEDFTQWLVRESEHVRNRFFLYKIAPELADETWTSELRHKTFPVEPFVAKTKWYRQYFHEEILGKFDEPL